MIDTPTTYGHTHSSSSVGATRQPRPSEVANRLETAATFLENNRWCREYDHTRENEYDMYEAILKVAPVTHWACIRAINTVLNNTFGVFDYNRNAHDKRKVTRLMRRTARNIRDRKLTATTDMWGDIAWQ